MVTEAGSTPVLIGPAAAPLRRALPASAWGALECLVARSQTSPAGPVVEVGVRDLAADLGVSKNTAQRALSSLARAGLVTAEHARRSDGTFRAARYLLQPPADALEPVLPRPTRRHCLTPSSDTPAQPTQLSLLGT